MSDPFASSDSVRLSGQSVNTKQVRLSGPINLEKGDCLPFVDVCYETWGALSQEQDNAVLICHAVSGDSHVAKHQHTDQPGWWDLMVGPGKSIDTGRFFVICSNVLGGCRGTTGPNSINPVTGLRYGAGFPLITLGDIVDIQKRLIDFLGIRSLHAVVGGSLGGMQALVWPVRYPESVRNAAVLASGPRLTSQALAFDVIARNAIVRDPQFHQGNYYDKPAGPEVGLALARMLGHITYLSREAMTAKFEATRLSPRDVDTEFEKRFSVGSYLAYHGQKFVERFDANSYVTLTRAMDLFDLGADVPALTATLNQSKCRWFIASFTSDWLFPPEQSRHIVDSLLRTGKQVSYCNIPSECGHDAFLLPDELDLYGDMVKSLLNEYQDLPSVTAHVTLDEKNATAKPLTSAASTNIFQGQRLDYDLMLGLIDHGSSVLDLGCGNGSLLDLLKRERMPSRLMGLENNPELIRAALARGFDVVHGDLEQPLTGILDHSFDFVVLSQTLQSISETRGVVSEMLRVGKRAVVSFPNFAYRPMRDYFVREGRAPKASGAYGYEWYTSPNKRFPSILDFESFCIDHGIRIEKQICLNTERDQRVVDDANLNADVGIFLLVRA